MDEFASFIFSTDPMFAHFSIHRFQYFNRGTSTNANQTRSTGATVIRFTNNPRVSQGTTPSEQQSSARSNPWVPPVKVPVTRQPLDADWVHCSLIEDSSNPVRAGTPRRWNAILIRETNPESLIIGTMHSVPLCDRSFAHGTSLITRVPGLTQLSWPLEAILRAIKELCQEVAGLSEKFEYPSRESGKINVSSMLNTVRRRD